MPSPSSMWPPASCSGAFPPTGIRPRSSKTRSELLVLSGKGHGTHANPDGPVPLTNWPDGNPTAYTLGQLNGTLRVLPRDHCRRRNLLASRNASPPPITGRAARDARRYPPFRHVVYIIKENRTYDQVLGDIKEGDGDASLVYFPDIAVTPNHHALARRFGLFDRFFVNAEVSSQGHIWSTAAYVTNYGEKIVPSAYAGKRADVDGEESDEPERGFLWTLAMREGITFRDYGEMVKGNPGWPVTQHDLGADVNPDYIPFDLTTQDQKRADVWIAELAALCARRQHAAARSHVAADGPPGRRASGKVHAARVHGRQRPRTWADRAVALE